MKKVYAGLLTFVLAVSPAFSALVAHWDFSDGTYDDQVGSLDGSAAGSVSIVDAVHTGFSATGQTNFTKAVQTGSTSGSDLVNVGDWGSLGIYTNSFTVSLAVKRAEFTGGGSAEFLDSYQRVGGINRGIRGYINASDANNAGRVFNTVGNVSAGKGGRVDDDQWHWFVIRYDGDTDALKYFEDGVHLTGLDETGVAALAPPDGTRDTLLGDGFGGLIADVRIYDTALSFTTDQDDALTGGEVYEIYSIPEPATIGLLMFGAVMVRLFVRRKG